MILNGRFFLDDMETGLYEVSEHHYNRYKDFMLKMWQQAQPKINIPKVGKPMIFGTDGDLTGGDFAKFFYDLKEK